MSQRTDGTMLQSAWAFCHEILPSVSRTFALNIPVLPPRLRDGVCCAYLLCRIADTIEDCTADNRALQDRLYAELHDAVAPDSIESVRRTFTRGWAAGIEPGYARLVDGAEQVFRAFADLPREYRVAICDCVREMISGMRRLGRAATSDGVQFLTGSLEELDAYCHYVAGTVGRMLTRLFAVECPHAKALRTEETLERGRRFGLGLQATNIIKDHADDVARGVCYVPRSFVGPAEGGHAIEPARRALLIRHALRHLDEALEYVLVIPPDAEGIRLFCVWAMMLALGTLREAACAGTMTPKVSRGEVQQVLAESRRRIGDDSRLCAWFAAYRTAVAQALDGAASDTTAAGAAR
ncbi:MAG: squalene/phytoene synthase family protein [Phycisphaerae bacterium]|nr:squalene/phytoene synthase family protein [Phycisphaerae bacterium]